MKEFVHLHTHTEYSLLDGAARIDSLFRKAASLNMPSLAITDHGNMFGIVDFFKKAVNLTDDHVEDPYKWALAGNKFRVNPIYGCEFYMSDDMKNKVSVNGKMPKFNHLILLAKNKVGYTNLIKISSQSYTEGLYYKPRIDFNLLSNHTEGLVCLSACIAGKIPQLILEGKLDEAERVAREYKSLFGDDFYIELQNHGLKEQAISNPALIGIARRNDIKLVATNDVHYVNQEDSEMQKVLQAISFRTTVDELNARGEDGYFTSTEYYLKSYDEMRQALPNVPDALENTLEIAAKCSSVMFERKPLLPKYVAPEAMDSTEFLKKITYEGIEKKYKVITDTILKRVEYELGVIIKLNFVDYFLIVYDYIHYSESVGIPVGPGRGSGVGSIVAYAIGITKLDPLKYDLIFERFLNEERVSNPDFDVDFCVARREEVIQYVIRKYGVDNVAQIVTFGTLAAKAAIKDVGRVYNIPYAEVESITKTMPTLVKGTLPQLLGMKPPKKVEEPVEIPDLIAMYRDDMTVKRIVDMAMKIEGMPRQTGMHAAGVVICRDRIDDHIALYKSSDGYVTTQLNMIECEELGLLKMDFLGLRTLTDIHDAIVLVEQCHGIKLDFYDMEYDDKGVFDLISSGETHAVFQLESEGMKKFMRELKPTSLEDIIAGISLYRPGPMDSIPAYIRGKHDPSAIVYADPILEPILNVTYGVIIYQEQVMRIVREMGGYSLGRADIVRRLMSKKKADKMMKEKQIFLHGLHNETADISGAIANGVPEEVATKVFDSMTSFASYAFNKSHAAAYAYLSYQTAYLKKYYTVEFVTAVLNNRITSIDEIRNYLGYLKQQNIPVLPPNINKSGVKFTVENGAVRVGMSAIKNVGSAVIEKIVEERESGDFTDFVQFVDRMKDESLNKKMLESLILAGTFDCFNLTRAQLIEGYESVLDRANKDRQMRAKGQFSFFDDILAPVEKFTFRDIKEYPIAYKLMKEKEVMGVYISGHPLEEFKGALKAIPHNTSMLVLPTEDEEILDENEPLNSGKIADGDKVTLGGMLVEADKRLTKAGKELGIGKLEDLYGAVEVLCSGYVLAKNIDVREGGRLVKRKVAESLWIKDKTVKITGSVKMGDGRITVWVDRIEPLEMVADKASRKICIMMSFSNVDEGKIDRISNILSTYPGHDVSYIKDLDKSQLFSTGIAVDICDALLAELCAEISPDCIKIAN